MIDTSRSRIRGEASHDGHIFVLFVPTMRKASIASLFVTHPVLGNSNIRDRRDSEQARHRSLRILQNERWLIEDNWSIARISIYPVKYLE